MFNKQIGWAVGGWLHTCWKICVCNVVFARFSGSIALDSHNGEGLWHPLQTLPPSPRGGNLNCQVLRAPRYLNLALSKSHGWISRKWLNLGSCNFHHTVHCVSKKLCKLIFCQYFVKLRPIVEIFGTKIAKKTNFSEVYSFSTSPNLCQRTTVLNADVPNCYITL